MRMGRYNGLHPRPPMPGGIVNRDDDRGRRGRWIPAGDILEMGGKGALQPLLFAVASLAFVTCWLLQQAGRQLPSPQVERGQTIHLIFVIPRPYHGPVALHAQSGVYRRHQRKTRFILAQQHTRPRLRFFFNAASSPCAACGFAGSPRR